MSRKKKNRRSKTSGQRSAPQLDAAAAADRIRQLIAEGRQKTALDRAKELHSQSPSPESEALLIDAYIARIESMQAKNLLAEARALGDLVNERFPASRPRVEATIRRGAAKSGDADSLLAPLANPSLPPEERAPIEDEIRRNVWDLRAVAQSKLLPQDDPLHRQASVLFQALEAACSGPVTDDALGLEEIPRRSPLAPWKMMVLSIVSFYRGDNGAAERYLAAVDTQSAPARLAPVLRALISGQAPQDLTERSRALFDAVTGVADGLRADLAAIEQAFADHHPLRVARTIQKAIATCRRLEPDLLERLRQHLAIRLRVDGAPPDVARSILGGPTRKDAYFWRLLAMADERSPAPNETTCTWWEQFRLHARHEGLIAPDSLEEAAIYVHMAAVLVRDEEPPRHWDTELLTELERSLKDYYRDQPASITAAVAEKKRPADPFYYLRIEELYRRACAIDPEPRNFRLWCDWAERSRAGGPKALDEAAEAWHRAHPADPTPLLLLVESAERRNALKKALGHLEAAEKLDALNPDVRRARLRLWTATALRHLVDRKPHLLEKDIEQLSALPQAAEGERAALIPAFRWAKAALENDASAAEERRAEVAAALQNESSADLLLQTLARHAKFAAPKAPGKVPEGPAVVEAAARACILANEMKIQVDLAAPWGPPLVKALSDPGVRGAPWQFRVIAETALRTRLYPLAYAASGAGVALDGPTQARFMFLRARSLNEFPQERRDMCIAAAVALARRAADTSLVDEAVELLRSGRGGLWAHINDADLIRDILSVSAQEVETTLRLETEMRDPLTRDTGSQRYMQTFANTDTYVGRGGRFGGFERAMAGMWAGGPDDDSPDDPQLYFGDAREELIEFFESLFIDYVGDSLDPLAELEAHPELAVEFAEIVEEYVAQYGNEPNIDALMSEVERNLGLKPKKRRKR